MGFAEVLRNEQRWHVEVGNALDVLRTIPDGVVQCCVTSPPYYGLRRYSDSDVEIGTEQTLAEYIASLVAVFREVRRVLRDDGVFWCNIGDTYWAGGSTTSASNDARNYADKCGLASLPTVGQCSRPVKPRHHDTLKPKDLMGVPWRLAFALQADGWWLRSATIWDKPNAMPQSVEDRPTSAYEHVFLLAKSERYFYDHFAVLEPFADATAESERNRGGRADGFTKPNGIDPAWRGGRNLRDVWTIPTCQTPFAHFATFPPELVRRCLQAGTSERGCCPSCGAPWRRVVERQGITPRKHGESVGRSGYFDCNQNGLNHAGGHTLVRKVSEIGWQPTCACPPSDPLGCVVLDPFNGSGTTGEVAMQLGCRYLGIDLNPDYAEIWNRRIGFAEAHPHTKPSYRQPAVNPAQPALFEA